MSRLSSRIAVLALLTVLSGCCVRTDRVDPIATGEDALADREYVGLFQEMGAEFAKRREYRKAWREYATLGDFERLRALMLAFARDTEKFDAALFESMVEQYAVGRLEDSPLSKPLATVGRELGPVATAHVQSGQADRARIAWVITRSVFTHTPTYEDRKAYYPRLKGIKAAMDATGNADVKAFAAEVAAEMAEIESRYHGQL